MRRDEACSCLCFKGASLWRGENLALQICNSGLFLPGKTASMSQGDADRGMGARFDSGLMVCRRRWRGLRRPVRETWEL